MPAEVSISSNSKIQLGVATAFIVFVITVVATTARWAGNFESDRSAVTKRLDSLESKIEAVRVEAINNNNRLKDELQQTFTDIRSDIRDIKNILINGSGRNLADAQQY